MMILMIAVGKKKTFRNSSQQSSLRTDLTQSFIELSWHQRHLYAMVVGRRRCGRHAAISGRARWRFT